MITVNLDISENEVVSTSTTVSNLGIVATQGSSLWEPDGVDHIKPKGGKTVDAPFLELGGKVDKETGKGLSSNDYTDAEVLLVATIPDKEDKVVGKGLSTNDFTDDLETKLNALPTATDLTTTLNSKVDEPNSDGTKAFSNANDYRLNDFLTGFSNTSGVIVNYDNATRKITLTGTFTATYKGETVSALVTGWQSPAHDNTNGIWWLRYNGSFSWTLTPSFEDVLIASVYYNTISRFGMRECHGHMNSETHIEFHTTVGAYKTAGGDFSGYTPLSTTPAERRPLISETTVKDEDLSTVLPALSTETYTRRYLSGASTRNFETSQADIISVTGSVPNYNQLSGVNWVQTPFSNNEYGAIFVAAIPVTADNNSQNYRYVFVQPQTVNASLSVIQGLTPSSLYLGDPTQLVAEFVFIGKIIVRYSGVDWYIQSVEKLEGTKISQVAIPSSPPSATSVAVTPSGNISSTNVQSALYELDTEKVIGNAVITGATKTKITYDAKGLVTAGADATTADIADSTNKRYITDAERVSWTAKQDELVSGSNIRTVNGSSLLGSSDLVVSGVPNGGTTDQVLAKASDTSGDVEWVDPSGSTPKSGTGTITTTGWVANSGDYVYKLDLAISGIELADVIMVTVNADDMDIASTAQLCSTIDSYAGGITFYAKTMPTATIGFSYFSIITTSQSGGDFTKGISFYVDGGLNLDTSVMSVVSPLAMTIKEVRLTVDTAPTGANLIIDINKNGTTVYTTQGNRPKINAGNTSGSGSTPDVISVAVGDKISLDIDQVGATIAGSNLAVTVICEV